MDDGRGRPTRWEPTMIGIVSASPTASMLASTNNKPDTWTSLAIVLPRSSASIGARTFTELRWSPSKERVSNGVARVFCRGAGTEHMRRPVLAGH